jgi:hypothetical protein
VDLGQYHAGRLGRLFALVGRFEIVVNYHSNVPLTIGGRQLFTIHNILVARIVPAHVHNVAFLHVEGHSPSCCPLAQSVQCGLQLDTIILAFYNLADFRIVCKIFQNSEYALESKENRISYR